MKKRRDVLGPDDGPEDLLFCSTGLLIVLLVVVLSQIGLPDVSAEELESMAEKMAAAEAAAAAAEEARDEARKERDDEKRAHQATQSALEREKDAREWDEKQHRRREDALKEELSAAKSELEPKPVDVVFVIDGTLSMKPVLEALRVALKGVAEVGSRLTAPARCRVGVVIYRTDGRAEVLELHTMEPSVNGRRSRGRAALDRFADKKDIRVGIAKFDPGAEVGRSTGKHEYVSRMEALSGYADVEGGVKAGISLFDTPDEEQRQVLFVIGDVGCWEQGNPKRIDPSDHLIAKRIRAAVARFVSHNPRARVVALFTGKKSAQIKFRAESESFFKSMARAAGGQGQYSDDITSITASVIDAAFSRRGD